MSWIKLTDRAPNPDEHPRVLIYTQDFDFNGEQFFDVNANWLNECYFEKESDQPEVCSSASHWMPLPVPGVELKDNHVLTTIENALKMGHKFVVCIEAENPKCSITISNGYDGNIETARALEKFARSQRKR